ncbi:6444_t:CDS:10 [Entrophospora sp. SA101]|nr:6444_t:CDS:10 [Entrophospora sp. SA101]CAJ0864561.1 138_t:CDS:10 [Entrophospora sp. SA101]
MKRGHGKKQSQDKDKTCRGFNGNPGSCQFGDNCRYRHVMPNSTTVSQSPKQTNYKRGVDSNQRLNNRSAQNEFSSIYQDPVEKSLSEKDSRGQYKRNVVDRRIRGPVLPELLEINKPPKEGFRAISILPTQKELLGPRPKYIPVNKTKGSYENIEEYLETHYKLLREDFLRPLRQGIQIYIDDENDEEVDQMNLRIYVDVNLVGVTFSSIGVLHRISFRTRPGERIHWEQSKRLIPGTLVVLTKDKFKTIKLATVVNRSLEYLKKPHDLQIDVLFRSEDVDFVWDENYTMVESTTSYFEAYRHVLKVIQELDPEDMPLKSHIIDLDKNIELPKYLENRAPPNYDFGTEPTFQNLEKFLGKSKKINCGLHKSQYEALERMLTSRLALVQGPPGTGKTYVGLAAVRILLENLSGTIVVSCQTNHALDQFLEGIQKFESKIVRLGSRSTSTHIKPCTLYNIRQDVKASDELSPRNPDINALFKEKHKLESRMEKLCKEIGSPCLTLEFVKEKKFLTPAQISSLEGDDWVTSSSTTNDNDRDYLHIEADFRGIDGNQTINGKYVNLRSESYVSSNTQVSDAELERYSSVDDLFAIPAHVRAAMHNRWRSERLKEVIVELKQKSNEYLEISEKIKNERIREDLLILKRARVVGMTTTAAAKYHDLLVNLKPKIIIIEEAAETLEAHIISALTPATEHLILIGDHKQLRPNTAVHELAEDHCLNVSLFERLIENELPFTKLTQQRRMRPEIRELLTPIYGDVLKDHPSVSEYHNVPGFFEDLFFFDHQEEESMVKESKSRINEFEAKMSAKLAVYLVNGGFDCSKITILSMYSGQRKLIQQYLNANAKMTYFSNEIKSIRVSSVDGFQGEENDVIILSLVRSREPKSNIGFLSVSNRVCVALSRAKRGMYIFGNATQLSTNSNLWKDIIKILEKKGLCDQSIDLYCQKHSKPELGPSGMVVINVEWEASIPSEGGCKQKCGEFMECGHLCPKDCHTYSHDKFKCREKCIRIFPCGHPCDKECKDTCGKCETKIVINPRCGHQKEVKCHIGQDLSKYECSEICEKKLSCGHRCKESCSSPWCTQLCRTETRIKYPDCAHINIVPCYDAKYKLTEGCPFC